LPLYGASMAPKAVRRALRRVLALPPVSLVVTSALRPVAGRFPPALVHRVPVVRTFALELPDGEKRVRLQTDGVDMGVMLFWHGLSGWEPEVVDVVATLVPKLRRTVCLDIGANVGIFSLVVAALDPGMTVHAFEPVPATFAALRRNVAVNTFTNVVAHEVALSDVVGRAEVHVPRQPGGKPCDASMLQDFRDDTEAVAVATTTVDAFVHERGIERVGLLKIDTEGTEHLVLEGGRETLARDRPFVICEVLRDLPAERHVGPLFAGIGYDALHLTDAGPVPVTEVRGDPTYRDLNFLFAPRETALRF
jgi:FkbM family methyltransferase